MAEPAKRGGGQQPISPVKGGGQIMPPAQPNLQRTPAQQTILFAKQVRDFLDQKTVLGPDGKTHEWRIWDQSVDPSGEAAVWKAWMARPRASIPWIILGNESGVAFEGPLPANMTATLALLAKYAPAAKKKLRKAA